MPLRPVEGRLVLPVTSTADIQALVAFGRTLSERQLQPSEVAAYRRDLQDYFYYMGAVCPQYVQPLQEELVHLPDAALMNFDFPFQIWLYLLQDAPDTCVDYLMERL